MNEVEKLRLASYVLRYTWKDKITATFLLKFQITFYYRLSNNLFKFVRSICTAKNCEREYTYLLTICDQRIKNRYYHHLQRFSIIILYLYSLFLYSFWV